MRINNYPLSIAQSLGDLFNDPFFGLDWAPRRGANQTFASDVPVDFYEDDANFYVRAELPGVTKEEVKVQLDKEVLTIAVDHKEESEQGTREQSVKRSLRMPENVKADQIRAGLENGILTLTLPKGEEMKPREILVS